MKYALSEAIAKIVGIRMAASSEGERFKLVMLNLIFN
jgi:hypothetical protein